MYEGGEAEPRRIPQQLDKHTSNNTLLYVANR